MGASSESIADDRVADRQRKEAEANGQHDEVQHVRAPKMAARLAARRFRWRSGAARQWLAATNDQPVRERLICACERISFRDGRAGDVIGISYRRRRRHLAARGSTAAAA